MSHYLQKVFALWGKCCCCPSRAWKSFLYSVTLITPPAKSFPVTFSNQTAAGNRRASGLVRWGVDYRSGRFTGLGRSPLKVKLPSNKAPLCQWQQRQKASCRLEQERCQPERASCSATLLRTSVSCRSTGWGHYRRTMASLSHSPSNDSSWFRG